MSASVAEMQSELLGVAANLARRHPDDCHLLAPFLSRDPLPPSPAQEDGDGKGKGKGEGGKRVKRKAKGGRKVSSKGRNLLQGSKAVWT